MGPLEETPVPTASRIGSTPSVDDVDLSIRDKMKLQQKAVKKAARKAKVKKEEGTSGKVSAADVSAIVTVVEPPLALAIVASPQTQRRVFVDLVDEEEEVHGDDQMPPPEEDDGSLRHR